ncbi:tRNA pseudouridine synthase-like 1 [Liolophura sinensis]|uniref:tRNA pseudouridine synthase-like 1 n=1 Tax=Liolophura sinensis TaxID=3198878 RepID=UPI003158D208
MYTIQTVIMGRYLLYFSYIGTMYRGLQMQVESGKLKNIPTILGALNAALQHLNPANEVKITTSSRTDAGVHALSNTVHVDLQHREPKTEFSPLLVTAVVNQRLFQDDNDIRILQTRLVRPSFHGRFHALARHYMYRFCLLRNPVEIHWATPHSAFENNRSIVVVDPLDVNRLHEAAKIFSGTHDFSAYTNPRVLRASHINPVKTVNVGVKRGEVILQQYQGCLGQGVDLWEIHVSSRSFLYKQVRRMVGAMLQYAQGNIDRDFLLSTLNQPSGKMCNFLHRKSAPAYGLYLKSVEYNPSDLEYQLPADCRFDEDISGLRAHIGPKRRGDQEVRSKSILAETYATPCVEFDKSGHTCETSAKNSYDDNNGHTCETSAKNSQDDNNGHTCETSAKNSHDDNNGHTCETSAKNSHDDNSRHRCETSANNGHDDNNGHRGEASANTTHDDKKGHTCEVSGKNSHDNLNNGRGQQISTQMK